MTARPQLPGRRMPNPSHNRGPETIGDALDALDARDVDATMTRADDVDDTPRWRARALYPETEGVAMRWRIGKDLTGALRAR